MIKKSKKRDPQAFTIGTTHIFVHVLVLPTELIIVLCNNKYFSIQKQLVMCLCVHVSMF